MRWTLARYFLKRSLIGLAIAFVIVTALLSLVDFVEATRDIDAGSTLGNAELLGLTLLKAPSLLEQTLPFIALFAAIGTLNGLNRRSELIAARAAGLSAWRYLRPSVGVALMLGVLWVAVGNPLAARGAALAQAIRAGDGATAAPVASEIWLRDAVPMGRAILHADSFANEGRSLTGVTYYGYGPSELGPGEGGERFVRRIDARTARFLPTGYWQFRDVREWSDGGYADPVDALALPTSLGEDELVAQVGEQTDAATRLPPAWELPGLIRSQARAGYSTTMPRMTLWKLLALPVLLAGMTVIGAAVSMRMSREGGSWALILTGGVVGFGVFFATVFVEAFGEVGTLPPVIATWTVPVLALIGGLFTLARLEDG